MKNFIRRYLGLDTLRSDLSAHAEALSGLAEKIDTAAATTQARISTVEATLVGRLSETNLAHDVSLAPIRQELSAVKNELENLRMQTTDHSHKLGLIHSHQLGDVSYAPRTSPSTK